eukprot:3852588-Amphidinium_carterae.1
MAGRTSAEKTHISHIDLNKLLPLPTFELYGRSIPKEIQPHLEQTRVSDETAAATPSATNKGIRHAKFRLAHPGVSSTRVPLSNFARWV